MTDNTQTLIHQVRAAGAGPAPHPALILLHGRGSSENDMMGLAPYVDPQLFVVAARAPLRHAWGGHTWYDIERDGPGVGGSGIQRSLEALDHLVAELPDRYPVDPSRVIIGGFSLGAAMSGAYALLHPERVIAAVMASGFLPPDENPGRYRLDAARGLPIFQAHGTNDRTVLPEHAHATRDFLQQAGVDLTYREYPMGHEVSPQELLELSAWLHAVLARPARV